MSFRDDRDALASRVDSLDCELGQARQELAEEQRAHKESRARERTLASRVEELEAELARLRPAPRVRESSTSRGALIAGGVIALFFLVVTVAIVGSRKPRKVAVVPDAAPVTAAAPIDAGVPLRRQQVNTLYRYSTLLCARLVAAERLRVYRRNRTIALEKQTRWYSLLGHWGSCDSDLASHAREPGAPPALAELAATSIALEPLYQRAAEYYTSSQFSENPGLGDQLAAEIEPRAKRQVELGEQAIAALRPAWLTAVRQVHDAQPDDRPGRMIVLAIEIMTLGADLARDFAQPGVDTRKAELIAPLLELLTRLRALADEDLTHAPPFPAARVLHLGNALRDALAEDGSFHDSQAWEQAFGLAQELGGTAASFPPE